MGVHGRGQVKGHLVLIGGSALSLSQITTEMCHREIEKSTRLPVHCAPTSVPPSLSSRVGWEEGPVVMEVKAGGHHT